jgi:hypothetical protein
MRIDFKKLLKKYRKVGNDLLGLRWKEAKQAIAPVPQEYPKAQVRRDKRTR